MGSAQAEMIKMGNNQTVMGVNPFVKVNLGYSKILDEKFTFSGVKTDFDSDNAAIYGMSAGVTVNKQQDIEFEFSHAEHENKKLDVKVDTYMLNYRYLFNAEVLRPYLLASIGAKYAAYYNRKLAYQVGFGTKYFLAENLYLDGSYRYQWSGDFTEGTEKYKLKNSNLMFGIAYQW